MLLMMVAATLLAFAISAVMRRHVRHAVAILLQRRFAAIFFDAPALPLVDGVTMMPPCRYSYATLMVALFADDAAELSLLLQQRHADIVAFSADYATLRAAAATTFTSRFATPDTAYAISPPSSPVASIYKSAMLMPLYFAPICF